MTFLRRPWIPAAWDGGLYGVPWYLDVRVIFYRADILAQAGWDHYPRTWDELEKMGRELSRDLNGDGKIDQYAINLSARDEQNLLPFYLAGGRAVGGRRGAKRHR